MKILLEAISFIGLGIIITIIFSLIRNQIVNRTVTTIKEKFETPKFLDGMFNLFSPVHWTKDLVSILNLRKITIYLIILGLFFGYGYWKGQSGKPIKIDLGYGKEANIKLDGSYLHIYKDGSVYVEDDKGNKIKQIQVKDIPNLAKKLKPYGIDIKPIGIAGIGIGNTVDKEAGIGLNILKYFDWRIGAGATQKGGYLGINYKLEKLIKWTHNTYFGLWYGKGYKGDTRILGGFNWEF